MFPQSFVKKKHVAREASRALWDQASHIPSDARPFHVLERAVRDYIELALKYLSLCKTASAREALLSSIKILTPISSPLIFMISLDTPSLSWLRLGWLARRMWAGEMRDDIYDAQLIYREHTHPHWHPLPPHEYELVQMLERDLMVLYVLSEEILFPNQMRLPEIPSPQILPCPLPSLLFFLTGFFNHFTDIPYISHEGTGQAPRSLLCHSIHTLSLIEAAVEIVSGEDFDAETRVLTHLFARVEDTGVCLDIVGPRIMSSTLWTRLLSYVDGPDGSYEFLRECGGTIEPLIQDHIYGQGVSVSLPWA